MFAHLDSGSGNITVVPAVKTACHERPHIVLILPLVSIPLLNLPAVKDHLLYVTTLPGQQERSHTAGTVL